MQAGRQAGRMRERGREPEGPGGVCGLRALVLHPGRWCYIRARGQAGRSAVMATGPCQVPGGQGRCRGPCAPLGGRAQGPRQLAGSPRSVLGLDFFCCTGLFREPFSSFPSVLSTRTKQSSPIGVHRALPPAVPCTGAVPAPPFPQAWHPLPAPAAGSHGFARRSAPCGVAPLCKVLHRFARRSAPCGVAPLCKAAPRRWQMPRGTAGSARAPPPRSRDTGHRRAGAAASGTGAGEAAGTGAKARGRLGGSPAPVAVSSSNCEWCRGARGAPVGRAPRPAAPPAARCGVLANSQRAAPAAPGAAQGARSGART
nr:uncharacterized protein LOC112984771 [Dromaius novaehollandiae]XP_025958660.1 uncharacterized protein LOC112984771 [Dromaius novaehollandiae]XP_025958670.1 uncharacterized protein LOC112984771 [Dromaius novaehollandiae]XP_025958679.1 uncharacterized protein LOC112984771 [Dromaius novaehollandiae]